MLFRLHSTHFHLWNQQALLKKVLPPVSEGVNSFPPGLSLLISTKRAEPSWSNYLQLAWFLCWCQNHLWCVCVCVHLHTCMHMYVLPMHAWEDRSWISGILLYCCLPCSFEEGSLTQPEACHFSAELVACKPQPSSCLDLSQYRVIGRRLAQRLQGHSATPTFQDEFLKAHKHTLTL